MVIFSPKSKRDYISDMKEQRGNWLAFGSERFTGTVIGPLLCMTYHMEFEWDRRLNPKTTAVGFVKEAEGGCTVHCLLLRGFLRPQLLPLVLPAFAIMLWVGVLTGSALVWLEVAIMWIALGIETLIETYSERGWQSVQVLTSFLLDPGDPYGNIKRI